MTVVDTNEYINFDLSIKRSLFIWTLNQLQYVILFQDKHKDEETYVNSEHNEHNVDHNQLNNENADNETDQNDENDDNDDEQMVW